MRRFLYVLSLVVLAGTTAQATVIDDFSSDSSALYNTVRRSSLDPNLHDSGNPAAVYARWNEEFNPSGGFEATTIFFRNDGRTFNVGDTIGIGVFATGNSGYELGGLALSQSPTSLVNDQYFYILNLCHAYWSFGHGATTEDVTDVDWDSYANIALTRTSDTTVSYDFAYQKRSDGTTVHIVDTDSSLTAGAYYFGMIKYGTVYVRMDNLVGPVPEPSTMVLLAFGLIGLLAYAWRKRK